MRDALSLLDQAIAHAGVAGGGQNAAAVTAEDIGQMLGLADRTRVIDLFDALMRGDIAAALKELRDQYDSGADPAVVLADLAEFTHFVTRVKVVPSVADDPSLAEAERTRGRGFAAALSMRVLARTWQMLFKGLTEVQDAGKPIAAAEMVLVRIAYAADLPGPDEVIRSLGQAGTTGAAPPAGNRASAAATTQPASAMPSRIAASPSPSRSGAATAREQIGPVAEASAAPAEPAIAVARFEGLIALAIEKRDLVIKTALERDMRLVRFEDGRLEVALEPGAARTMIGELSRKLSLWTGRRWMVVVSAEEGAPTVKAQADARKAELLRGIAADPLVQAVLTRFPGAEIVDVRSPAESAAQPGLATADDAGAESADDDGAAFDAGEAVGDNDED